MCHVSTVSQTPQCWCNVVSCWMPWLSCVTLGPQLGSPLGKTCCVYLKRSFLVRNDYKSDSPDSFESTKPFCRHQAFITSVGSLEMQNELSVYVWLLGGRWEPRSFPRLRFPLTAAPAVGARKEAQMRVTGWQCCCRRSASYITCLASLDSGDMAGKQQQKCPVAIFSPERHL